MEVTKEDREIERIIHRVTEGFRADLKRIMSPRDGDLKTEQQAEMMGDLLGWHRRAVCAEAALTAAQSEAAELRGALQIIANPDWTWATPEEMRNVARAALTETPDDR